MSDNAVMTILNTSSSEPILGFQDYIANLEKFTKIEVSSEHVHAVVGQELAGETIKVILSDPAQAIKNAAEIGLILWGMIKAVHALGKKLHLTKKIAYPLLFSKSKQDAISDKVHQLNSIKNARVWGPMEIDSINGPLFTYVESDLEALVPFALLMAVIVPIHRNRSRTYWNILKADGHILGSWTTQTLTERLPDFIRPL